MPPARSSRPREPPPRWRRVAGAPRSESGRSTVTSRRGRRCSRPSSRRGGGDGAGGGGVAQLPPWEALSQWLHQYVGFAATKRALTEALLDVDPESGALSACRIALVEAGNALVERAQAAGAVRPDTSFLDIGRMVSGIAVVPTADPEQQERMLSLALDGLRYRPGAS